MNNLNAIRAIASINGKNKILIAIPCHSVIFMSEDLTDYAGEIWRKNGYRSMKAKLLVLGKPV